MQSNGISVVTPDKALLTDASSCKKCGAEWKSGNDICPWCGADKSETQILPFNFSFPKIEPTDSKWNQKRSVPMAKAIPILFISIAVGAILYYLLAAILAFSMILNMVILVLCVYVIASVGISVGISAIFKRLINVWGKGNSTWLTVVTSLIIFVPSALRNTILFWAAGGVQGIMSLIMGLALPVLGIVSIGIYIIQIGSGKFCPYCDSNLYLRKDVMKIHSCNTAELIRRIYENEPKNALSDLDTPEVSKHAFTTVDLCICKKPHCRHAQISVYQHMMHMTYNKQNQQLQENDVNQLIAEHEIAGDAFDLWTEGWSKKDSLT